MVSDDKSAWNYFEDPLYMMSYFPQLFQISLFVFVFQKFDCDVPRYGYLSLSCLEFATLLGYIYIVYFPSEFGMFVHYFFKYYFHPFLTFFSFCGFCYAYTTVLCGFSQTSEIQVIFISIFSLFLRLNNFSWSVFKFTWFFLLPLQICAELLQLIFHFSCTFQLQKKKNFSTFLFCYFS